MIRHNQIGVYGRLGNQLFQYAAVRAVSLRNGWVTELPGDIRDRKWHGQTCLLSNFNLKCEIKDNPSTGQCSTYKEIYENAALDKEHSLHPASNIHPSFFQIQDNTILDGHFENHLYFHEYREQLRKELTLINGDEEKAIQIIKDIKEKYGKEKEIVSIHFRRGDVVNQQQKLYAKGKYLFSWDSPFGTYLEESLKHFHVKSGVCEECDGVGKKTTDADFLPKMTIQCENCNGKGKYGDTLDDKYIFLLFTGGQRNENTDRGDMDWIKKAFTKHESDDLLYPEQLSMRKEASKRGLTPNRIIYAENNSTLLDFALMKNCDHNITGLHSTYSWWASYLNNTPNKKTISPRVFSDPKQGFYPEDFILTDWAYQKSLGHLRMIGTRLLQSSYAFINSTSQFTSVR
tara:strand:+ start:50661 stop:51866 length:1206 start_codon:yes stop_codon:yes gene_type:complete